jgi:hypothetical protein
MRILGINSPDYQNKKPQPPDSNASRSNKPSTATSSYPLAMPSGNSAAAVRANGDMQSAHNDSKFRNHHQSSSPVSDSAAEGVYPTQSLPRTHAQYLSAQHSGEFMQASAKETSKTRSGASGDRVRFFTQAGGVGWNAYGTAGPSASHTGNAVPDNTAHKARAAISEYLQTQFIEERLRFTEALGIDDYA